MLTVDQQLHGYRQGHQLLVSTLNLDKIDQDLVDRLSDVAGPLRPGEIFTPYLTGYPLPSGSRYVLARTWQDLKATRAGCVRTISLFIRIRDWATALTLSPFLAMLDGAWPVSVPANVDADERAEHSLPLPPLTEFRPVELVEALFLEDRKPIVMFDVPNPELVTKRLITALWPALRSRFAFSTFALSPRKLYERSFDLVFAPKDARPRFVDWDGRRIDGRETSVAARHKWTEAIVASVFVSDVPKLLGGQGLPLLVADESGSEEALRIAILWNELHDKLNSTPWALLGLLDIANTREKRNVAAIRGLEPALAQAASQAVATMPGPEAWAFLDAMTRKLGDLPIAPLSTNAIRAATIDLAAKDPVRAIEAVSQAEDRGLAEILVRSAGDGDSQSLTEEVTAALVDAPASTLVRLLLASPALAERALSGPTDLPAALARALHSVDTTLLEEVERKLLRLLVEERHAEAAAAIIEGLDRGKLLAEVQHLYDVNRLATAAFFPLIAKQAHKIGAASDLRDAVVALGIESGVDRLLAATLRPTADDVAWLVDRSELDERRRSALLLGLLRSASPAELRVILSDQELIKRVIVLLGDEAQSGDVLRQLVLNVPMPIGMQVSNVLRLFAVTSGQEAIELANTTLERCLRETFGGDETTTISTLLGAVGQNLNGPWLVRRGLDRDVQAEIASRNLVAFEMAPPAARMRILEAVEEIAQTIQGRYVLDLSAQAVEACAAIFCSARTVDSGALLRASIQLLPFLLKARQKPASPLIAAVFPPVYRELRRGAEVPDIFRLFIFIDWDRCKTARHELVDAFMTSTWRPVDLGLAAVRAGDAVRILKRVAHHGGGGRFMETIERDLRSIAPPWREKISSALHEVRYGPATISDGNT